MTAVGDAISAGELTPGSKLPPTRELAELSGVNHLTAVRAYNGIRTHIPLINALASNSPFWFGEDSGLASSRTVIL